MALCNHNAKRVRRPHDRLSLLLNAHWATYKGRFAVRVVESDESLLCYQFHLSQTLAL